MSNYIPHGRIICGDRDPPWINKDIKQLILDKISYIQLLHSQWYIFAVL